MKNELNNDIKHDDENIIIGKISGVYGVKGWVKVYSYTDPREAISQYSPWYLKQQGSWKPVIIESCKPQAKTVIAKIEGCEDRDAAMLLSGTEVAIKSEQLESLEEGKYYWRELIGLQVRNQTGFDFGTVKNLMETGSNDVLVVKSVDGRETLIPWTMDMAILSVDLVKGEILVDWDKDF